MKPDSFDDFFEVVDVPILILSPEGNILRVNERMQFLMGVTGVSGLSDLSQCLKAQNKSWKILEEGLVELQDGKTFFTSRVEFRNLSRSIFKFEIHMKYLGSPLDNKKNILVHFFDRTKAESVESKLKDAIQDQILNEHKLLEAMQTLERLNQELKEMQDQLIQAEKLQSVGRLAAGVAHEVKNPLAIIVQGLEYLERQISPSNDAALDVVKDLNEAVRRADEVIKGLLDYATPQDPKMEMGDICLTLDKALDLMKQLFKNKSILVKKEFSKDLPLLNFDSNRMYQVFVNLFSNALHAMTKEGTLYIRVMKLRESADGRSIRIEIQDTGKGIPKEFLKHIFDPFATTRRDEGGTGLGMSVVKGIVEMHRGGISINNHPDGGAIVRIDL